MLNRAILLCLGAAVLAGCETLPSAGPSSVTITTQGDPTYLDDREPDFALIDVDRGVADALESRAAPDFTDVFPPSGTGASFRIALGDTVNVTIWESLSAGLSGGLFQAGGRGASGAAAVQIPPQVVSDEGRVTVPFAGRVPVLGRTAEQVERDIVSRLQDKAIDPQAIVVVEKAASNVVTVLGEGARGGAVSLSPGADRITDVIAATGGLAAPIEEVRISLTRQGQVATMPLNEVFENPAQNIRLAPGDIIAATREPRTLTAIGATGVNRRVNFGARDFYLSEALGDVGGVLDSRGDPTGVYVMRLEDNTVVADALGRKPGGAAGTPVAYRFDMNRPETFFLAQRFKMQDRDIIYVTNAPSVALQKLLDIFRVGAGTAAVANQAGAI